MTKRTVLRARVIIRDETVTDFETVEAGLRRELISFETSDLPEGSFRDDQGQIESGSRRTEKDEMQIDKATDHRHASRPGYSDKAQKAQQELPGKIDTHRHQELL